MLQILFALLAGLVTVGAPCILPVLPIVLAGSVGHTNRARPFFITLGFVVTFAVVGLLFSTAVSAFVISANNLRIIAIALLAIFGLFLLWPYAFEKLTAGLAPLLSKAGDFGRRSTGNAGGFLLGMMLGILWTPCAGPVLGSILTLVAAANDSITSLILLTAYAVGAGIPLLLIAYGGQYATTGIRQLTPYTGIIQKIFGLLLIALAVSMYFGYDVVLQQRLVEYYPQFLPSI